MSLLFFKREVLFLEEETFDRPTTGEKTMDSNSVTINVESIDGIDGTDGSDGGSIIIGSVNEESSISDKVPGVNINFNISKLLQKLFDQNPQ